jgi:ferritin-like protein
MNRTGMATALKEARRMAAGAVEYGPSTLGDSEAIRLIHRNYYEEAGPVGNVPTPKSLKGKLKAGMEAVKGNKPTVLLDKLGERLAFERTGTRLYEAVLEKFDAFGGWEGGPTRDELQQHHDEELRHFRLIKEAINSLGGDPTVMTPAADITGVASEGLLKVITDPRTSLAESLEALLTAELVDNDSWQMLIALTGSLGHDRMSQEFQGALEAEQRHLESVRRWLNRGMEGKATRKGAAGSEVG